MTPQQQAIAIYEAMGWKWIDHPTTHKMGYWENADVGTSSYNRLRWMPNEEKYTHDDWPPIDHNFLAQAREELLVTEELRGNYDYELNQLTTRTTYQWELSPAQQLTALLKALGLWTE